MQRTSGILLPVFSLPNDYGIGTFGSECFNFIDFLEKSGQGVWQILPLVQTGYGNSPYSSVCSFSLNPFFISPEILRNEKLLTEEELSDCKSASNVGIYVDYGALYNAVYPMLKKAFARFNTKGADFIKFVEEGRFSDYALFCAIKEKSGYKPFFEWNSLLKDRDTDALKKFEKDNYTDVLFYVFIQYEAEKQWKKVKKYANAHGVKILGDMPLYPAADSVDVWVNPNLYKLDENLLPKKVAGVPPDYFCAKGQLWGNPVFNYAEHEKDGFSWWKNRIKIALKTFDYVRIDHFRGLDRFYEIDAFAVDATNGVWVKTPSEELFSQLHKAVKKDRIIAEDLGIIDDGVRELLKHTGYPGMKILSFAFNGEADNLYLPEHIGLNSVAYTGTHDNDTLKGLVDNFSDWDKDNLYRGVANSLKIFGISIELTDETSLLTAIKELNFACAANLCVTPFADVKNFGEEYRINEPGTVKTQNWAVRFKKADFDGVSEYLNNLSVKYDRRQSNGR